MVRLGTACAAAVVMLAACGGKPPVAVTPEPPALAPVDLIVLLPDSDGSVGAALVTTPHGSVGLETARASTRVPAGAAPSEVTELSEADVSQLFGDALGALPPPAQRFTLYFRFESEELTVESRGDIPRILRAVTEHPAPEVLVVGHTDTTGAADRNVRLGLRRALAVRDLLVALKLDHSAIEVASYGETDPLVKTADEVFEPRNRRVEITVR